jgi:hypothetical protein
MAAVLVKERRDPVIQRGAWFGTEQILSRERCEEKQLPDVT